MKKVLVAGASGYLNRDLRQYRCCHFSNRDYQGNKNLLDLSKKNNVSKFIYVSVINAQLMKDLKGIQAKLLFEDKLKESGLDYAIEHRVFLPCIALSFLYHWDFINCIGFYY